MTTNSHDSTHGGTELRTVKHQPALLDIDSLQRTLPIVTITYQLSKNFICADILNLFLAQNFTYCFGLLSFIGQQRIFTCFHILLLESCTYCTYWLAENFTHNMYWLPENFTYYHIGIAYQRNDILISGEFYLQSFIDQQRTSLLVTHQLAENVAYFHRWAPMVKKTSIGSIPIIY